MEMTIAFESLPGNSLHLLDGPQFGLTRSPDVNRFHRHGPIMHKPHTAASLPPPQSLRGHSRTRTLAQATFLGPDPYLESEREHPSRVRNPRRGLVFPVLGWAFLRLTSEVRTDAPTVVFLLHRGLPALIVLVAALAGSWALVIAAFATVAVTTLTVEVAKRRWPEGWDKIGQTSS